MRPFDQAVAPRFNWRAIAAIYRFEMARTLRTPLQSIVSPVLSTSLYFVVFGAAIGAAATGAGFCAINCGCVNSAGEISPGVMITRAPMRVQLHSLVENAIGMRIQPWDAG